tara:strand:- start:1158 stop:1397 length:240 start_codon:yes stop_codon:yes gene_type:complete
LVASYALPSARRLAAIYRHAYSSAEHILVADQIVVENGAQPLLPFKALEGQEVYRIGDALSSRDVHTAVRDAYSLAITP